MWISSKATLGPLSALAAGAVAGAALFAGSAGGGAKAPQRVAAPVPRPVPSVTIPPAPPRLTLEVSNNVRYGPILVTPAGMTVYRQVGAGVCSARFHPLLAAAGQRLRLPVLVSGRLGTVTTSNAARQQVTYDGWPVYVYSGDHAQGDTTGTGAHWQVISPHSQGS